MTQPKQPTIEHVTPDVLKPAPYNPRRMDDAQRARLERGIKEFGLVDPIIARRSDGMVIGGHQRLTSAINLGLASVPVVYLDDITDERAAALNVLLNNPAAQGQWDFGKLSDILSELDGNGFDATLTGFDDVELQRILSWTPEPQSGLLPGVDPDDVPEAPKEPITKPGDLITLGRHRLVCGDSLNVTDTDRLMNGKKAEMLFTDPPYGVDYEGGHFHSGNVNIVRKREKLAGDATDIYADFLPLAIQYVDGPCYVWFAGTIGEPVYRAVTNAGCQIHALIIWHKINATYAAMNAQYKQRHECLLYFKPHGSTLRWCGPTDERTVWEMKRDGRNTLHPTQKPVELATRALGNHNAPSVLDLFAGSGSTLIAAEQSGRTAYLMEISPAYCDVIVTRWEHATGQTAVRPSHG